MAHSTTPATATASGCAALSRGSCFTFLFRLKGLDSLMEIVRLKLTIFASNFVQFVPCVQEVLERHGALGRRDHIDIALLRASHPISKLFGIWHSGGQQHHVHMRRQHNNHLFPNDTSLLVVHVMYFVENHVFNIAKKRSRAVQHSPQHLGGHN